MTTFGETEEPVIDCINYKVKHITGNHSESLLTLYHTIPTFNGPDNIKGKGKNAGNQLFLFFFPCFLPFPIQISIF